MVRAPRPGLCGGQDESHAPARPTEPLPEAHCALPEIRPIGPHGERDGPEAGGRGHPAGAGWRPSPEELANDLETLGPTFVKLGQVLSTRPDLLPEPYLIALARLQDSIAPFPFEEAQQLIESELQVRISKAFQEIDPKPIATASLGQVHRAILRNGRPVVVKVQRPNIRDQVRTDLEVLVEIATFLDKHTEIGKRHRFADMLDEFARVLQQELDYRLEAQNLEIVGQNLAAFERIVVPAPVMDYTTSRVLTMDYVRGRKITTLSPLARTEINGCELAEELFRAYFKQVLTDGIFHADPHPGNVFLTDDGRLALLDLGMVSRISPPMQERLLQLLLAIGEGRGDAAADMLAQIGQKGEDFEGPAFRQKTADVVLRQQGLAMKDVRVGRVMIRMIQIAAEHDVRVPPELTMLGKTLLSLDEISRTLDPEFDPNLCVRQNAATLIQQRLLKGITPGNVFASVLEAKEFAQRLPGRVNRILDALAESELKVKVDVTDQGQLLMGLQKVANRIALGLVLAALIVGAAMLMQVRTTFTMFGYPGFAILCFIAAASGGVWLAVSIILTDRTPRKRRPGG